MYLSKSKFCDADQCIKMLWLNSNKPEVKSETNNDGVLKNGTEVGELAKGLFGEYIDIQFDENLSNMIDDTKKALENKNCVICEASFTHDNNFCSVDILVKNGDSYEIYEVKSSTDISDRYRLDASYQYYVLKSLGLNVTKCCVVHINSSYVRNGDLDIKQLFRIVDITDYAVSKFEYIKKSIKDINKYMEQKEEPLCDIGEQCFKPYSCPYFEYCSRHLGEDNVFNIKGMQLKTKLDLYKKGKYKYRDLLDCGISPKYRQVLEFELGLKETIINLKEIKKFLSTLSYPLYFLDFETFQQSIPMYDGISPYMQIPFQYSLHYYLEENGDLQHSEFLAEADIDPRRSLALQLVKDIPMDVCVLAYNMSFEKSVLRKLAELYPDLSEHLMNIHDNMKDLMIPFKDRDYYTRDMHGSFSIKAVLPALFPNDPSLDYHNLDMVHKGDEASEAYANMGSLSEEEREVLRENMLKYCNLDTYAMVKIFGKLKEL